MLEICQDTSVRLDTLIFHKKLVCQETPVYQETQVWQDAQICQETPIKWLNGQVLDQVNVLVCLYHYILLLSQLKMAIIKLFVEVSACKDVQWY